MNDRSAGSCAEVSAYFEDYLDNELTPQMMQCVLRHLTSCAVCQARCLHAYHELALLRGALQDYSVPAELMARLRGVLPEYPPDEPGSATTRNKVAGPPRVPE